MRSQRTGSKDHTTIVRIPSVKVIVIKGSGLNRLFRATSICTHRVDAATSPNLYIRPPRLRESFRAHIIYAACGRCSPRTWSRRFFYCFIFSTFKLNLVNRMQLLQLTGFCGAPLIVSRRKEVKLGSDRAILTAGIPLRICECGAWVRCTTAFRNQSKGSPSTRWVKVKTACLHIDGRM